MDTTVPKETDPQFRQGLPVDRPLLVLTIWPAPLYRDPCIGDTQAETGNKAKTTEGGGLNHVHFQQQQAGNSHCLPSQARWEPMDHQGKNCGLDLSREDYKAQMMRNPGELGSVRHLCRGHSAAPPALFLRAWIRSTHASNDYPWGLFLGFGLFGMVPLSASGFLLGTTVEIFGRKDFVPIERLALLNGLLGYFFAVVYLEVDLGMPWRLYYPMFVSLGAGGCPLPRRLARRHLPVGARLPRSAPPISNGSAISKANGSSNP